MTDHVDAYKLITYRAQDNTSTELVWNSRNVSAPTYIVLRDGKLARRVAVRHDPYLPQHTPSLGDMILVECCDDWALTHAEYLADTLWAKGDRRGFDSQDAMEASLLAAFEADVEGHYGRAVVVTAELAMEHGWATSRV
jgi:hypothetical protein